MDFISFDSIKILQEHLFRNGRTDFSYRWAEFAMESILADNDSRLSALWKGKALRSGYVTATQVAEMTNNNKSKNEADYDVVVKVLDCFRCDDSVAELKALLKVAQIMIEDKEWETKTLENIKSDIEVLLIFAEAAEKAQRAHDTIDEDLQRMLSNKNDKRKPIMEAA